MTQTTHIFILFHKFQLQSVFSKLLDTTKNFLSNFNISRTPKSFSLERINSAVYILYGVLIDRFLLFVFIRFSLHLKRHKLMALKSLFLTSPSLRNLKIVVTFRGGRSSRLVEPTLLSSSSLLLLVQSCLMKDEHQ